MNGVPDRHKPDSHKPDRRKTERARRRTGRGSDDRAAVREFKKSAPPKIQHTYKCAFSKVSRGNFPIGTLVKAHLYVCWLQIVELYGFVGVSKNHMHQNGATLAFSSGGEMSSEGLLPAKRLQLGVKRSGSGDPTSEPVRSARWPLHQAFHVPNALAPTRNPPM